MKKVIAAIAAGFTIFTSSIVNAEPTCVLMKFTDDTRFDLIESAASISDLVFEKMMNSGKFRLMETRPIDENMEIQLYDEKMRDLKYLEDAVKPVEVEIAEIDNVETVDTKNIDTETDIETVGMENITAEIKSVEETPAVIDLNPLFEGVGFDENKAQTISGAQVGQIINPEITSAIGKAHNAEYLIQGTIINLGTGAWWSEDFEKLSGALNLASAFINSSIPLGALGDVLSAIDVGKIGVGVQCDLRIIRAETGEVIWTKRVVGVHSEINMNLGIVSIGNRKLNNNFYTKGMNKAAQKIVDAMLEDIKHNKLLLE